MKSNNYSIGKPTSMRQFRVLPISNPIRSDRWLANVEYVLRNRRSIYTCVRAQDSDPSHLSAFDLVNVQLSAFVVSQQPRFWLGRHEFFGILKYPSTTQILVELEPTLIQRATEWANRTESNDTLYTDIAAMCLTSINSPHALQSDAKTQPLELPVSLATHSTSKTI